MNVTDIWLDDEHRQLDHALAEVEFLAERRAFAAAGRRFREFQERFIEHLRREERDFPEALLRELRPQHAQLETALEAVANALVQHDFGDFTYGLKALESMLRVHHATEERLLMSVVPPRAEAS